MTATAVRRLDTRMGGVAYWESGDGEPLLLLHGMLHDASDFDPIVPRLARTYRVITLDWPGHRHSGTPIPVTAPLLADTLDDVVTGLGLGRVRVVGSSVGGYAAARLAVLRPMTVAALVLVNSGGFGPHGPLTGAWCRTMGLPMVAGRVQPRLSQEGVCPDSEHDRAILARAQARARTGAGVALASSLWASFADPEYDLRGQAGRIRARTLIVWGRRDRTLPVSHARGAHRMITGSQLRLFDTGHVPFSSRPEEFLEHVEPFLAQVPA